MEQVTGFVPRVLTDALAGDGVALLRAEDRVFEAMLDGWRAQMLARGLTTGWIKSSTAMVTRFQRFTNEYPWTYAYGLRRRELTMLETTDFGPNPHVPADKNFGCAEVRYAKRSRGSGPRRRTVLTSPEFDWVVGLLGFWVSAEGRGRFPAADRSLSLWPGKRAGRITLRSFDRSFQMWTLAGLPLELSMHALRHSYVTHQIEAGYDPAFIQAQVGHSYASTTGIYTHVPADFKHKTVQRMIAQRIGKPAPAPGRREPRER